MAADSPRCGGAAPGCEAGTPILLCLGIAGRSPPAALYYASRDRRRIHRFDDSQRAIRQWHPVLASAFHTARRHRPDLVFDVDFVPPGAQSQAGIFKRSVRFERKMKIAPENGSCWSCSRTTAARLSAPRRKSTGFVATRTFTPAGTAIVSRPSRPAARPAARRGRRQGPREPPRRRSRSQSSGNPGPTLPTSLHRGEAPSRPERTAAPRSRQAQQTGARRLAPREQMLRRDVVPARHLRHHRARRIGFRHDPALSLIAPPTPAPRRRCPPPT
jgi:hypothetical protein